jgi:hypothetical protein
MPRTATKELIALTEAVGPARLIRLSSLGEQMRFLKLTRRQNKLSSEHALKWDVGNSQIHDQNSAYVIRLVNPLL